MKRPTPYVVGFLVCTVAATMLCAGIARAATCEKWAGKVVSAQGVVEVKPAGETRWQPVKLNETYCPGDTIRTDRKSRADIALYNHPILRLDQNSTVTLGGMKDEKTSLVDMLSGAALFFSRVTRNLEVRTATVNAGVEGTEFFIRVEEGKTDLTVFEGKVLASNAEGTVPVATGQSAVAEAGKAPVYRVVVRPRDAVTWALYYPPVFDPRPPDRKEESGDPRFFTARASQMLAVGRVDEATADIDRAQKLDPKSSDAFALQSIIAVTQNEKGKAIERARKAVESDPKSATARIALSYAQQAHFDLKGALGSLEEAVKLAPGNALAWARLAELQQMFGYLDKSLDAAKKAVASNPDLSRTQTVLGFSHLTRIETKEAREAFEKAIRLDDADPIPRMGLGLAKIRDGNLEEGRREIEIAMSLDPNSSIIRSYLGKAYYEEKRAKLATGQYEMAKSLDPADPTPYFYDAIEKQTANRPVDALRDMEKSIELNDNRAVYRSRLLLDQDIAAREASMARIYSDLGFQELALVEGYKSVNADPANFSAHRFLSDSYANMPRAQISRVSELLQAQLLQPINISPIQPRLGESNLLVVSGGGAATSSFLEFNPLFERNRAALQLNGTLGEQSTAGGEVVGSMLANNLSASAGYYGFRTDGYRANDDVEDHIFDLFAQASLSPKTSIQGEYRKRDTKFGFLEQRPLPDDFYTTQRNDEERESWRLGFHHAFSPGSDLIGNFTHSDENLLLKQVFDPVFFPLFQSKVDRDANSGELSYLLTTDVLKLIAGAGYFSILGETQVTRDIFNFGGFIDPTQPPDTLIRVQSSTSVNTRHSNAYAYMNFNYPRTVTFTLGGSYDDFSSNSAFVSDANQFNPKFGITWNPFTSTTIRAAAFRALKRTLVTDQTLEPTQVAGFNQFYDDPNGTEYWKYGVAVDQKFSGSFWGGAEFYWRDMTVPIGVFDAGTFSIQKVDWKEEIGRAYLFWTPTTWVGLNGTYYYEQLDRGQAGVLDASEVTTQRVPLGANFFHPTGLSAMFKGTYYDQTGKFTGLTNFGTFTEVSNEFWVFNAAIGYRLPQRYGFLSVGATNLFDRSFHYFDSDYKNPAVQPVRTFFARVTLSL